MTAADLLIIEAMDLKIENPLEWMEKQQNKILRNNGIPIPTLVINPSHYLDIAIDIFEHITSNWYYDFIHPDQLNSITIRIANLLKIHDHLHELNRYEKELTTMQSDVDQLKETLTEILKDS